MLGYLYKIAVYLHSLLEGHIDKSVYQIQNPTKKNCI